MKNDVRPPASPAAPPSPVAASSLKSSPIKRLPRGAASRDSKEYLVENLSMLLSTGVTVGEALGAVCREMPSKKVKKTIEQMIARIDEGAPFWSTLEATGLLSNSAVALIHIGEDSGHLADNLKVVADQMHKANMMTAKIRSALLYPAFLVVLLFIVGMGIGIYLLPKLADIFNGLDVELGLMTRTLISTGRFMGKYGFIIAFASLALMGLLVFGVRHSKALRGIVERLLFHIPGVKKLLYESELARFGFILGSLLEAGLPVVDALDSLTDSMSTKRYRDLASYLRTNIEEGNSFTKALEPYKDRRVLPGPVRQLIVSAEKSGNLSPTLLKVGQIYEDKADITARNLETMLEPIILVLIAVVVLFIALAVILPIYSLIGGLDSA